MTTVTKRFIALSDIAGIRLECANDACKISLVIGAQKFADLVANPTAILHKCPNCETPWTQLNAPGKGSGFEPEVRALLRQIEKVRELDGRMGCHLSFELKPEE